MIVAHGGLAREYVAAIEHVVGMQSGIKSIAIDADHDRSLKETEICAAAESVDTGAGVVMVTDMFGGSPSNLSLRACRQDGRRILYDAGEALEIAQHANSGCRARSLGCRAQVYRQPKHFKLLIQRHFYYVRDEPENA